MRRINSLLRTTPSRIGRRLAEIVYHVWKEELDYFVVLRRGVVRG